MAYKKTETTLTGDIPTSLHETFGKQVEERSQVKKLAIAAAIRLWTELPLEIQAKLLNQSMSGSAFIDLVQQIVDERIEAGFEAGKALVERLSNKPGQKG